MQGKLQCGDEVVKHFRCAHPQKLRHSRGHSGIHRSDMESIADTLTRLVFVIYRAQANDKREAGHLGNPLDQRSMNGSVALERCLTDLEKPLTMER